MLTIDNLSNLSGTTIGNWEVLSAFESGPISYLNAHHFCITFERDSIGAAVLIDREENRLLKQYHIYICYSNFNNIIQSTSWSKGELRYKKEFFEMVTKSLDYEYHNQKIS